MQEIEIFFSLDIGGESIKRGKDKARVLSYEEAMKEIRGEK
jgi:hypothetical protein